MTKHIELPHDETEALCRKHNIERLSFFGSVVRDDFDDESDIDVLIEFAPDAEATYFDLVHAEEDLKELLGPDRKLKELLGPDRKLDVLTPGAIHPGIRDNVMGARDIIYEAR